MEQMGNCTNTRMLYELYDSPVKPAWPMNKNVMLLQSARLHNDYLET
jgi:hypothetical protein